MPVPKALAVRPTASTLSTPSTPTTPTTTRAQNGVVTADPLRPQALETLPPEGAASNAAVAAAALAVGRAPASPAGPPAGAQDAVGNGAVVAAGRREKERREKEQGQGRVAPEEGRARAQGEGKPTGAGEAPAGKAVKRPGPHADPKFAALKKDVRGKKRALAASHRPAGVEAGAAQDAARPPKDDEEAQGKTANAEKMNEAKPKEFDKEAFIRAVEKAVAAKAPKNLDEADKFADSGKADQVRAEVDGQVGRGKQDSAEQIATTTAAPPDTSAAVPKKVVPLTADRPPGAPGAPDPAQAVPDKLPPAATDLSEGPADVNRRMADAQVTEVQLKTANEPAFTQALGDKKAAERHSATTTPKLRQHESAELRDTTARARRTGVAAMAAMGGDRAATGRRVDTGKGGAKDRDEEKRAQVTAVLQSVFDTMKKDVETILTGLDKLVDDQFTRGEKAAREAFTAEHKRKMHEYKHRRYSGLRGKWRWVRDKFAGLPAEADKIFEEARDTYVRRMRQVISDIATTIGSELNRAKRRIADGRTELQTAVRELPSQLRAIGRRAATEFEGKFDELTQSVDDKGTELVDTLATRYTDALKSVDEEIAAEKEKNKGLVAKAVDAVKAVINTILELKRLLLAVLARAAQVVLLILKDPVGFLRNLVTAVGAGLRQFLANIGRHLQQGIMSWLLGRTAEAGLELPAKFDTPGVFRMLASLLGLSWANLRDRIVRKVPGMEPAVTAAETSVPLVAEVRGRGVAGMWDEVRTRVGDLRKDLLDKVIAYVTPTIVVAGIMWVISLLNPASAFVRAVKLIIDIVRFVVTQARQIFEFVNAVLDAVIAIARGGSGGVPAMVERALARSIPVLLGVLAAILGVGGIASRVKGIVQAMAKPVNRVIDAVIDKIVGLVRKLWAKLRSKDGTKKADTKKADTKKPGTREPGTRKPEHRPDRRGKPRRPRRRPRRPDRPRRRRPDGRPDRRRKHPEKHPDKRPESEKDKKRSLDAAVREATRLLKREGATPESVERGLPAVKRRHRLTEIRLKEKSEGVYVVHLAINPQAETDPVPFFDYKIGRPTAPVVVVEHPRRIDRLRPVRMPMKGRDPVTGFVVNMPATPDQASPDMAARYDGAAWAQSADADIAAARTAVVIGINTFKRLDPKQDDEARHTVATAIGRISPARLPMAAFGFVWEPSWVRRRRGRAVPVETVRAAYKDLTSGQKEQVVAHNESGWREKLPYGIFREQGTLSSFTERAVAIVSKVTQQVYVVSQDPDTEVKVTGGEGFLSVYDRVLRDAVNDPLLVIGGYHFEGFDWGPDADPRTVQLTLLANRLDGAMRVAIGQVYPQILYPTEQAMLFKVWERDTSRRIRLLFNDPELLAVLRSAQGGLWGIGAPEGRHIGERIKERHGSSVRYREEASVSTDALPGTPRGYTVTPEEVRRFRRGHHPRFTDLPPDAVYAVLMQTQAVVGSFKLASAFAQTHPIDQQTRDNLRDRVFSHVETVARLMSKKPWLTPDSETIQRVLNRLDDQVLALLLKDEEQRSPHQGTIEAAYEVARKMITTMTGPELKELWTRLSVLLRRILREGREQRGGGGR